MKNENGSIVLEALFVVPALMLVITLMSFCGRITATSIKLHDVASVSARRASQASVASMERIADSSVRREIYLRKMSCSNTKVEVSVMTKTPDVQVSVSCQLRNDGLGLLGLRPRVISASASSVIDRYRRP